MPSNPNRDFMQQMRQNDQRFQRFAQQNMKRQQDQFKNTADGWARDARRRAREQQQRQVQQQWQFLPTLRRVIRCAMIRVSPSW
jgi:hypothetical protein